ncbi:MULTISPECIES: N-acyl-D-amino-acid deacylase family protein [Bradyrhizobium]|jgi:N-acyl-D-amino-acid deacylase|uniref:D-aminoacylase n=3 Tax=Bradyrhizobium TaxID=374 RepID=A0ABS5G2A0_9BRAD|nr:MULTISPECIES: D-aminoacylase [Bradyrhizobium]ABQ33182.1 D-aminoacylase [Bradyrhizobium sp. BTAi1]MBR1135368.1 D-aminoacylase [Bradyrhizobium denitrificans]MDU1490919.1 D-aminoacylase [Bradyrhizobium sp.]MDU1541097.1 D-aminoacylase [Bradyrhizobium sp.]MDU1694685.1 D-aminoacylase [Bradyrhizobium sp.]
MTDLPTTSPAFDLIIRGGTVIDGTRAPRFQADVGITDGRIAVIGPLDNRTAAREIDATGRIVAPGFIDSHTHDDSAVLVDPGMTCKVSQGVTSVVTGNCGVSIAPLKPGSPRPMPLGLLSPGGGQVAEFASFAGYVAALRAAPAAVNVAPMVGHTSLRASVVSDLGRAATDSEIGAMRSHVQEALDAGAIGVSTGTFYPPAEAAPTAEIIEVCRPLTGSGGVYATHMRNEADQVTQSLEESFAIGKALDVQVVISHHKVVGPANFGRTKETLPLISKAMSCQCVALDCYPYNASSTMLHTDPAKLQVKVVVAASGPHPEVAGRDLAEIAAAWGVDRLEAAKRLQPASAIYFAMDEADVRTILAFEPTMIGSDGLPFGERPHPRLWGTFPRVLGYYCRELELFSLETAVWKMSGLTARNFGIKERGTIAVGNHADITIFDASRVRDAATYDDPCVPAAGIEAVIVNGALTWWQGTHQNARAGQVITRATRR